MDKVQRDRVLAWVGDFASEADFNRHIEERYTEDGDSIPSGFMRDIGVDWFDHDFQEFVFHDEPIPIEEAMKRMPWHIVDEALPIQRRATRLKRTRISSRP